MLFLIYDYFIDAKVEKHKIPFLVTKSGWNLESTRFMKSVEVNYMEVSPLFSVYILF